MGRIRTIKPEFFKHADLYDAEIESGLPLRVAYAGLWTCCDREGRFKWRPRSLKLDVLPYDDCDFSRVLDALRARGFIVQYASENELYGYVPTFLANQVINNRESESILPNPKDCNNIDACLTREERVHDAAIGEGKGREGKGREQKPSRAKTARAAKTRKPVDPGDAKEPTKSAIAAGRHAEFKTIIGDYWASKNPGVQMPWDGREGKQLEMFLRAAPEITAAQFREFLRNRFKSEVNHGERCSMWIQWVTSYAAGPMDRFGKTIHKNGGNGNGSNQQHSPAKQRVDGNLRAIGEALAARGVPGPWSSACPDSEEVSKSGTSGVDGGISGGLRATDPEILPPES